MRQNVIKAAAEAATVQQRACMCMCGAKETLSSELTRNPLRWEVQKSDLLDVVADVTRATLHGFCSALTSRQPRLWVGGGDSGYPGMC